MGSWTSISAHAKLNLHLEVVGQRADGYHELRTVLQSIDLHDTVELRAVATDQVSLRVEPEDAAPEDGTNLVVRAVHRLREALGVRYGVDIRLFKRVPAGAGLGGGSTDAAAILRALPTLWGLELRDPLAREVAATLGSDVPFFLTGGTAVGVGRGDEVYPLPELREHAVVVAWPQPSVSTPAVYARLEAAGQPWSAPAPWIGSVANGRGVWPCWELMHNDLQAAVETAVPEVGATREAIARTAPLIAAVTGSGGASFGVYASQREARHAAQRVASVAAGVHVGSFCGRWGTGGASP
jgi:4-diphosphocytidyl-2-C-methyl-D-erythritol kinase